MKSNNKMFIKSLFILLFIFTFTAIISARQNTNKIYTLANNEEYVYGKIGMYDNGSRKYTFAVVRTPNPNKTVYRRELTPYRIHPLISGGTMPEEKNVQAYDKFDYFIIFNGQKLGPYDRFMEMNQLNSNIDDWVSPDGKTITFTTVQGQMYRAIAANQLITSYWSHAQVPIITEAPGKVAFAIQSGNNNWNLTENRTPVHRGWKYFSNLQYSDDGSILLYVGAPERLNEKYIYINHKQVAGPYAMVLPHLITILEGTNIPVYLGLNRATINNKTVLVSELTVGNRKVPLPENVTGIARFTYSGGKLGFVGKIDNNYKFFVYNVSNGRLQSHGDYAVSGYLFATANNIYFATYNANLDSVCVADDGKIMATIPLTLNQRNYSLHAVNYRISPKGDLYAFFRKPNDRAALLKNGTPYAPAGADFAGVNHFSFNAVTGEPQISIMLDKMIGGEKRRIIHGNKISDVEGGMDNFESFSAFSVKGNEFYWVKRIIHSHNDWRWQLFHYDKSISDVFYGLTELTISDDGKRYAALVSDSPQITAMFYYSTNIEMHKNRLKLFIDGKIIPGNFGAPTWSEQSQKFEAIAQNGKDLVVRQY